MRCNRCNRCDCSDLSAVDGLLAAFVSTECGRIKRKFSPKTSLIKVKEIRPSPGETGGRVPATSHSQGHFEARAFRPVIFLVSIGR